MPTAYNMNIQQKSWHAARKAVRSVTTERLLIFMLSHCWTTIKDIFRIDLLHYESELK